MSRFHSDEDVSRMEIVVPGAGSMHSAERISQSFGDPAPRLGCELALTLDRFAQWKGVRQIARDDPSSGAGGIRPKNGLGDWDGGFE
jgi:hypothetical protein